ncbi:glycosyltransferase [Edaphobacter aggregans]|uniref:glycosyltransferase n=1 Tax=Edaphobacter aggregans TaxID=570835 RepID=UPI000557A79E|nr:glycosyltransferase [Edaphobacter aggregans]
MKIVHVVYSLEMGGAEVLVAQLCRLQRANGHDVSVIAYSNLGALGETLVADGIPVLVLGEAPFLNTFRRFWTELKKVRPEVVHCHNPAPTLQAAIPAKLSGARCVVSTRHSLVAPPYHLKEERAFNFVARFCDWIVGICDVTCENLRNIPGAHRNKIVRVYNGVDPIAPAPPEQWPEKRGFTLLFVGRLAPIKSLHTLIRASVLAAPRVPGLRLWIVGHGHERQRLEDLVKELGAGEVVTFWGERLDVAGFFSVADVYCMSSTSEGLPMSLLQAMSAGLPAIVTDVGGMAEVVKNAHAGLTTPVGDSDAMAEAIVQMASDERQRTVFRENAQTAYGQLFTLERMDASYMELYLRTRS